MAKNKRIYGCTECGATFTKWAGQCGECQAWNTLVETVVDITPTGGSGPAAGRTGHWTGQMAQVRTLAEVSTEEVPRQPSGSSELDRVLGGGLVSGSVVLIGGDPGIGKSTILLQTLCQLAESMPALYVTGEESQQQVAMRARRLGLPEERLRVMTETCIESIIATARLEKPRVMVVDSIQTIFTEQLQSAPGGVSQVRESAALLVRYAKQSGTAIFLVGHVTKDGSLAGPRVLEHMVDTVLYFEGESDGRLRMLRAVKNRFGAVNELGVFAMTDKGLKEVSNPSAIFLSRYDTPIPGSVVMSTWEGSRPMLVEVQALVDTSHLGNPRRVTLGLDQNRLAMLLAVLHRHGGVATYDQDVFVNVVGGVKVLETAVDLALLAAVMSSLRNRPLPMDLMVFGELGLSGEIRPVPSGQERLKEAAKHGFTRAIVPKANAPKESPKGMQVIAVTRLDEALAAIFD
ncbi:MAG: DNA repair protein RadA/Sms [Halopseudomonas sp.]|jgi:DNA repair protein RadA/Sms|uniref:DNA repair protein RadA n=1 Tax=Halopseudomonas sp. TaxID=2901191 RepID=UPI0039E64B19